jgi:hypothetical protein
MYCDDSVPHGRCLPEPCEQDEDCPLNHYCEGSMSDFDNGCRLKECAGDGDCDCGACIQNTCRPRIFVCASPPAA